MKTDRLLTLQLELYFILSESTTLKVGVVEPPWEKEYFSKVVNLARFLTESEQSVVKDPAKLESWLDKLAFFRQEAPKAPDLTSPPPHLT